MIEQQLVSTVEAVLVLLGGRSLQAEVKRLEGSIDLLYRGRGGLNPQCIASGQDLLGDIFIKFPVLLIRTRLQIVARPR
jgi:hypothetical protein